MELKSKKATSLRAVALLFWGAKSYPNSLDCFLSHSGLDKSDFFVYNKTNSLAERLRGMVPKGITVRKVRASQDRIADNVGRG